jgi:hypothetical protein
LESAATATGRINHTTDGATTVAIEDDRTWRRSRAADLAELDLFGATAGRPRFVAR